MTLYEACEHLEGMARTCQRIVRAGRDGGEAARTEAAIRVVLGALKSGEKTERKTWEWETWRASENGK